MRLLLSFFDVDVRWPGSVHDSRIFNNGLLSRMFQCNIIPDCPKSIVDGEEDVPICILGDEAYALQPFLMKEFVSGGSNYEQDVFGYRLSSARMTIEDCFGILKGRFRILKSVINVNMDDLRTVIYVCFVLHNFLQIENESNEEYLDRNLEIRRATTTRRQRSTGTSFVNERARNIRNTYVKYFSQTWI